MMSFDQWYYLHTGINTEDLTDEEYEALWADEELMGYYNADMIMNDYLGGEE